MLSEKNKAILQVLESVADAIHKKEGVEALSESGVLREQTAGALQWCIYMLREELES